MHASIRRPGKPIDVHLVAGAELGELLRRGELEHDGGLARDGDDADVKGVENFD